jgi:hypothetical protein
METLQMDMLRQPLASGGFVIVTIVTITIGMKTGQGLSSGLIMVVMKKGSA